MGSRIVFVVQRVKMAGDCPNNCEGVDGYYYLSLYDYGVRPAVAKILSPYPKASMTRSLGGYASFGSFASGKQDGFVHIERATGCGGTTVDRMGITDDQCLGGFSLCGLRELSILSFLAFIFLSDFVLYSPLFVIVWIPVGIFIIRYFSSQERELPTLSENLVLKPPAASTDVTFCLSLWRRYRSWFGYSTVVVTAVRSSSVLEEVLIAGKSSAVSPFEASRNLYSKVYSERSSVYDKFGFQELKELVRRRGLTTRGRSRRVCIDQLEAEDIRLASLPACVLNLDASSAVETVVETEESRTRAGGFAWPHIEDDSTAYIPTGRNYKRVSNGWMCLAPVSIIEMRLSKDCCLNDFPGYVPLKSAGGRVSARNSNCFSCYVSGSSCSNCLCGVRFRSSSKKKRSSGRSRSSRGVPSKKVSGVVRTDSSDGSEVGSPVLGNSPQYLTSTDGCCSF
jgi:hypothetical protein